MRLPSTRVTSLSAQTEPAIDAEILQATEDSIKLRMPARAGIYQASLYVAAGELLQSVWLNLPQLPHAGELIAYLRPRGFKILTGLPVYGYDKAAREKPLWIKKHFGADIEVICCLTKDKSSYCRPGDILIDDREATITEWRKAGGIGIFHTSWPKTLAELQKYGY